MIMVLLHCEGIIVHPKKNPELVLGMKLSMFILVKLMRKLTLQSPPAVGANFLSFTPLLEFLPLQASIISLVRVFNYCCGLVY